MICVDPLTFRLAIRHDATLQAPHNPLHFRSDDKLRLTISEVPYPSIFRLTPSKDGNQEFTTPTYTPRLEHPNLNTHT
jgi:hypothetical protein